MLSITMTGGSSASSSCFTVGDKTAAVLTSTRSDERSYLPSRCAVISGRANASPMMPI